MLSVFLGIFKANILPLILHSKLKDILINKIVDELVQYVNFKPFKTTVYTDRGKFIGALVNADIDKVNIELVDTYAIASIKYDDFKFKLFYTSHIKQELEDVIKTITELKNV